MKYFLILLCSQAFAQGDIEDRWNNIYQQYYSQSMTDEEWSQIAGERINETYGVQQGDTLWDISITLFGNGYYWPKIWQLNSGITNPHIIKPGYELHFIPGTTEAPPSLQIADGSTPPAPSGPTGAIVTVVPGQDTPGAMTQSEDPNAPPYTSVPVIPPPTIKSRPVLMKIPGSLPYLIATKKENNFDEDGFSFDDTKQQIPRPKLTLHTYISEEAPAAEGTILEAEGAKTVASLFEYVYASVPNGAVGQRFTTYHLGDKIADPDAIFGKAGIEVQIEGEIELTELVNPSKNLYKAIVKKSINPVRVGSFLQEGQIQITDGVITDDFAKVSGQVIGGEYDGNRHVLGLDSIIYFNVGEQDGVEVGQMMRILKRERTRKDKKSYVIQEEAPIAMAKIINVTAKRSTGVVLQLSTEIRPGDYAGDNTYNAVDASDVENELKTESLNLKQEQQSKVEQSDEDIDAQEKADEEADQPQDDSAVEEEMQQNDGDQDSDVDSDSELDDEEAIEDEE